MVKLKERFTYLADGNLDVNAWMQKIADPNLSIDVIRKAVELAEGACKGLTTFYGQSCLEQGLEMGEIILDMKLDQDAIAAAILTTVMQHTNLKIEIIQEKMGESIAKLIQGVLQLNVLHSLSSNTKNSVQIDRLRKTFLSMASDIRVILIKLAERTCIMRGIKNINTIERKRLAQETMDIYAPLANRLGIGQIKWELEDFAFHYTNPDMYKKIAGYLAERRTEREARIQNIKRLLKENLEKLNIQAAISGRAKHIYSIYLKMQRKNLDLKDIYDYSAVRILVPDLQDCYAALSIAHSLWEHLPNEFDDYINHPKPNGYRSIHTAVIDQDGKNFEIQIRTHTMHEEAEHGVAAHWIYKENKPQQTGYEEKITLLRQLLDWHKDLTKNEDEPNQAIEQILEDRVYVFTPAGDIIDLPVGATPLDFAYHIHSALGNRCRGAKIKGHIVPLTYALRTGDQVEIITVQNGTPSRDWLRKDSGYLKTARARAKVMQWFRQQDHAAQQLETNKPLPETKPSTVITEPVIHTKKAVEKTRGFQVGNTRDLLTRIARCCKPIPGDTIIGYITQGRGVSIHKRECSNIAHALIHDERRVITVSWDEKNPGGYYADLQIHARGSETILRELTALLANAKVDLITLNSSANKKNNIITILMTIQINDIVQLSQLMNQIKQLPHVINIKRTSETE